MQGSVCMFGSTLNENFLEPLAVRVHRRGTFDIVDWSFDQ